MQKQSIIVIAPSEEDAREHATWITRSHIAKPDIERGIGIGPIGEPTLILSIELVKN